MNEIMNEGLHFVALGGAEKVGMNMYAYIVNGRIIVSLALPMPLFWKIIRNISTHCL